MLVREGNGSLKTFINKGGIHSLLIVFNELVRILRLVEP